MESTIGGEHGTENYQAEYQWYDLPGLDTVDRYLKRENGVLPVSVDWKDGSGEVVIDPEVTREEGILRNAVFQGHYSAKLAE